MKKIISLILSMLIVIGTITISTTSAFAQSVTVNASVDTNVKNACLVNSDTEYIGKVKKQKIKIIYSNGNEEIISTRNITDGKNIGFQVIEGKTDNGITYTMPYVITPEKTKINNIKFENNKYKVTFKKVKNIDGFEVQTSKNKQFSENVKLSECKTDNTFVCKKTNNTNYIRIRTFKNVDGIKYYSSWSNAKKIAK